MISDKDKPKEKQNKLEKKVEQFLEYLEVERNVSPLTIRNYKLYLKRFSDWLSQNGKADSPSDLTMEIIRKYRLYLSRYTDEKELTLKRITQSYYLIALRSFLKYLVKNDEKILPPEKIELPKSESRSLKFLNSGQVEALLSQPKISDPSGLRDKAILELLFSTGLRVSELQKLNRDKLNMKTREFGIIGKGGRARVVFLSSRAVYWLSKYLEMRSDDWKPLFVRQLKNDTVKVLTAKEEEKIRLSVRTIERVVAKYCRLAKLPIAISPHGLRHSFATDLLSHGADIRSVQEMLGHKNIQTTQIYTHVTNAQLKEVHKKFHSGNK